MPTATSSHLHDQQLASLRRQLEAEQDRLVDLYDETLGRTLKGDAQIAADPGDLVDQALSSREKEEALSEREADRDQLRLVEEALERLDAETYGFCQYCAEPIAFERLQAVPDARYCAVHQAGVERNWIDERHAESWPARSRS